MKEDLFYILIIWASLDSELIGPYRTEKLRDRELKEMDKDPKYKERISNFYKAQIIGGELEIILAKR